MCKVSLDNASPWQHCMTGFLNDANLRLVKLNPWSGLPSASDRCQGGDHQNRPTPAVVSSSLFEHSKGCGGNPYNFRETHVKLQRIVAKQLAKKGSASGHGSFVYTKDPLAKGYVQTSFLKFSNPPRRAKPKTSPTPGQHG